MMRRALVGALLLVAASTAWANMLVNPGFEDWFDDGGGPRPVGYTYWGLTWSVDATHGQATLPPLEGNRMEFIMGPFWGFPWANSGVVQTFPAIAGETYTFSCESYATSLMAIAGGGFAVAKIEFWNDQEVVIGSNEVIIGDESTVQDVWQPYTVSAVAPADTAYARPVLLFLQPNGNDSLGGVYVDAASFTPEPASLVMLAALTLLRRR